MAKTNFQIFNEENAPERTYNDSEYKEATQRVGGVMPGMALSRMHNKMYYQWSAMCKAIANLIVHHGHDCMDNDVEGITRYLEETIVGAATTEINAHCTAAELDHPQKSVKRKHLADNIYTLPAPEPADNTRFLRNDGTYQTITPNNIGAYHKSESYNKGEVDGRVNAKVSKSGDTMTGALNVPIVNYLGEFGSTWIRHGTKDSDDAIYSKGANLEIGSWYGIGFYDTWGNKYTGSMNLRSGNWRTVGAMTARTFYSNDWFRATGNSGFYFEDHGGGWQMTDNTWIRSHGNKNIYTAGRMKADGGFEGTATNANKLQNWSLQQILDEFLNVWHSNKAYTVGDIAYHKNLPSWARLECVTAGTTGNNANVFSKSVKAGQYIQDGGVRWIVDDVRDCNRVGTVTGSLYLPDGYVKANGATVQRADYPRLVALANKYNLWTDNTAANAGMFGRGNGSSTFVLPNWIDRMAQFAAQGGSTLAAGLPNITGQSFSFHDYAFDKRKGAFIKSTKDGGYVGVGGGGAIYHHVNMRFDASDSNPIYGASNTVQPAAIRLIPIIKY
jgi:hypothetical protein